MQVINTNVMSLNAQRNLSTSGSELSTALERLSSGLRINSAKDDAAGMAISERMTSQIRGINQAVRNANDGISLTQTAEGALNEVSNNLQRIRELSVQAANSTNSTTDRAALQLEVDQLTAEINRVASHTNFNGTKLLDGSFSQQKFQVGANAGETVSVNSIVNSQTSALGSNVLEAKGTAMDTVATAASGSVDNGVAAETDLTITTAMGGTTSAIAYDAKDSAKDIAAAINDKASAVGVSATATNSASLKDLANAGAISFKLNDVNVSATISDKNDLSALVTAINGVQGSTGVTAAFTSESAKDAITLTTSDGRDIALEDFASDAGGTETIAFGKMGSETTLTEGTAVSAVKTGTVSLSSSAGAISLTNHAGDVFDAGASSFSSLETVDISTATGATEAISTLDAALAQINTGRANLGAIQNRFESVVSSLQITSENLSASRSRIQDADFAAETAAMTRAQILQQAGTAMLAQANSVPQNVLSLLR